MDGTFWMQLIMAGAMGYMAFRMWPAARDWIKHGPRGTANDWLHFSMLIAGVILFVVLLMYLV